MFNLHVVAFPHRYVSVVRTKIEDPTKKRAAPVKGLLSVTDLEPKAGAVD